MLIKKLGIFVEDKGKKKFVPITIEKLDNVHTAIVRTFDTDTMADPVDTPVIKGDDGQLHRYSIVSVSNNAFAKVREIKYTGYPDSTVTTMTLLERLGVLVKVFDDISNHEKYENITRKTYGIERKGSIGFVCIDEDSLYHAISLYNEMVDAKVSPVLGLIRKTEPSAELAPHYITSKQDNVKLWVYKFDALDVFEQFKPTAFRDRVETIGDVVELD